MKGLELAKAYYETYGKPMIEEQFSQYQDRIAVGLVGHGSECFGYDDEISADHDYGPGFQLWITEEDEREIGFKLFRAYSKLPKEFMGVTIQQLSHYGGDGKGVSTIRDFYKFYTGTGDVPESLEDWLSIPPFYLAEATNGEVFADPLGEFSRIRKALVEDCPEDVWLKRLASELFYMTQTGQYNYSRCFAHGERGAAAISLNDFAKHTVEACYILNRKYSPYYKWSMRGLRELEVLSDVADELEALLEFPYHPEDNVERIETICQKVALRLRQAGLVTCDGEYLEGYVYAINNKVKDGNLRNMPVML